MYVHYVRKKQIQNSMYVYIYVGYVHTYKDPPSPGVSGAGGAHATPGSEEHEEALIADARASRRAYHSRAWRREWLQVLQRSHASSLCYVRTASVRTYLQQSAFAGANQSQQSVPIQMKLFQSQ